MRLGALEARGSKMICAVGTQDGAIEKKQIIPTRGPGETMDEVIGFFADSRIEALGIASFGPVDVHKSSATYGYILDTPKEGWRHFDLLGTVRSALCVPVELETDMNGACLGEMTFGIAKGLDSVVYVSIGTGIGAGVAVNGLLLHGMLHPEAGHMLLRRHPRDGYEGICPFHATCFEGLASGPAIAERWGRPAETLIGDNKVWEMESHYIAQAMVNLILVMSPRIIILGGGVMKQEELFPMIRKRVKKILNEYLNTAEMMDMDHYIVPASLQGDQGILGCIELARRALMQKNPVDR
ncbi:MAG: ROK family protein [Lachnospiraceae bacterium]|jgi:fructokinase|nr:ROK family protein [Lachnospiraceae bacterium]